MSLETVIPIPLPPISYADDEWVSNYEEHLLDLWDIMKKYIAANGLVMLDQAKFPQFAQFCYHHSTKVHSDHLGRDDDEHEEEDDEDGDNWY
jgi:hypothetical protein